MQQLQYMKRNITFYIKKGTPISPTEVKYMVSILNMLDQID